MVFFQILTLPNLLFSLRRQQVAPPDPGTIPSMGQLKNKQWRNGALAPKPWKLETCSLGQGRMGGEGRVSNPPGALGEAKGEAEGV